MIEAPSPGHLRGYGTAVAPTHGMLPEPNPADDTTSGGIVHRFTVQRGMLVAIVIETTDWYSGLLQAAIARARIEGTN